jgi:hypothetical protein
VRVPVPVVTSFPQLPKFGTLILVGSHPQPSSSIDCAVIRLSHATDSVRLAVTCRSYGSAWADCPRSTTGSQRDLLSATYNRAASVFCCSSFSGHPISLPVSYTKPQGAPSRGVVDVHREARGRVPLKTASTAFDSYQDAQAARSRNDAANRTLEIDR